MPYVWPASEPTSLKKSTAGIENNTAHVFPQMPLLIRVNFDADKVVQATLPRDMDVSEYSF